MGDKMNTEFYSQYAVASRSKIFYLANKALNKINLTELEQVVLTNCLLTNINSIESCFSEDSTGVQLCAIKGLAEKCNQEGYIASQAELEYIADHFIHSCDFLGEKGWYE